MLIMFRINPPLPPPIQKLHKRQSSETFYLLFFFIYWRQICFLKFDVFIYYSIGIAANSST